MPNDRIKELYRPNMMGLHQLRNISDPVHKMFRAMATKPERDLIDLYSEMEDEYYNRTYMLHNLNISDDDEDQ